MLPNALLSFRVRRLSALLNVAQINLRTCRPICLRDWSLITGRGGGYKTGGGGGHVKFYPCGKGGHNKF